VPLLPELLERERDWADFAVVDCAFCADWPCEDRLCADRFWEELDCDRGCRLPVRADWLLRPVELWLLPDLLPAELVGVVMMISPREIR